jgi:hypothetical protein
MENLNSRDTQDVELVITTLANKLLEKATLADAFSAIPLDTIIQLVKNQAIEKAKKTVDSMPKQDLENIVQQIKNDAANNSSDQ